MADCVDAAGMYDAFAESAARLQAWHDRGRSGERPLGRLRPLAVPELSRFQRWWAGVPLDTLHDPDGRPGPIRGAAQY